MDQTMPAGWMDSILSAPRRVRQPRCGWPPRRVAGGHLPLTAGSPRQAAVGSAEWDGDAKRLSSGEVTEGAIGVEEVGGDGNGEDQKRAGCEDLQTPVVATPRLRTPAAQQEGRRSAVGSQTDVRMSVVRSLDWLRPMVAK